MQDITPLEGKGRGVPSGGREGGQFDFAYLS